MVEFHDAKSRLKAWTPNYKRRLVFTDDGGLCLRQVVGGVSRVTKNCVAILEAKNRFLHIDDGSPVISDKCFAQMTCEALAARLADPTDGFQPGRFVTSKSNCNTYAVS